GEMYALLFLSRLCLSTERFEHCATWFRQFEELFLSHPDPALICEASIVGARLSLVRQQVDEAKAYLDRAKSCIQSTLDLPRLLIASCEIETRLATDGSLPSIGELNQLVSLHTAARNLGCLDEVTVALV